MTCDKGDLMTTTSLIDSLPRQLAEHQTVSAAMRYIQTGGA